MSQGKTLRAVLLLVIAAGVAALGVASPALAVPLTCDNTTGVPGAGECQITTLRNLGAGGTFEVDRTLHIIGPIGELRTNANSTLTLNIAGGLPNGLIIDSGGKITGNSTSSSTPAATININVTTGNILLDSTGATISANNTASSCGFPAVGRGGIINISASGVNAKIITEDGTTISVNGLGTGGCSAGEINISAPFGEIEIDGNVLSQSNQSGTGGNQRPGGGPIKITAGCALTISETGVVSSKGLDPGADLVRLTGCVVQVFGLVESTGRGHAPPNRPTNQCFYQIPGNPVGQNPRPGKSADSTACVEILSGTTILIDSVTGSRQGEVNADIGFSGGPDGRSWIDLFANGDINVFDGVNNDHNVPLPNGGNYFSQFAVHANMLGVSNAVGGDIRAYSTAGSVAASGHAFQADATLGGNTPGGGTGGSIDIQGALNLNFNSASMYARGDFDQQGGFGVGGDFSGRAFQGSISWTTGIGDVRPTGTSVPGGQDGTITLTHCNGFASGATFPVNGLAEPNFPTIVITCPGPTGPTLPTYITLPPSTCLSSCGLARKSGMKFNDLNNDGTKDPGEPGLPGWEIHLFNADLSIHLHATTDAGGNYAFETLQPGTYTVCETLQTNWNQTFPVPGPGIADCTTHTHGGTITPGPRGYLITLTAGQDDTGNDFGNFQQQIPQNLKRGVKFNDLNGDGVKDVNEPGLQGWEIHMFDTATGGQVFHEHRFTDANGVYSFSGVPPNAYTVCETQQSGWVQTFPTSGADCSAHGGGFGYSIVLAENTQDTDNDFGNRQIVRKSGTKFHDLDSNGVKDPGEPGLQGWEIHLFNADLSVHLHVFTDANGNYEFSTLTNGLQPGTYTVCETLQAGWTQTAPAPGPGIVSCAGHGGGLGYSITLTLGDDDTGNDFGNRLPNSALKRGLKFNDLNGNGQRDPGEPPLSGWTIHIFNADLSIHQHVQTAADGTYQFTVPPGTYTVCETVQNGWTQTFPTPGSGIVSCAGHTSGLGYQVTLVADQIDEGNDFGNQRRSVGVPTLSEWGMLLFVLLLIGIACRQLQRKQGSLRLG